MPKIIVLDLDESLFEVTLNAKKVTSLSDSAVYSLSEDVMGVIPDCALLKTSEGEYVKAIKVTAMNREQMKEVLFDPVFKIIQDAGKAGKVAPIKIVIITAATYTEQEVKAVFDKFYGDEDERFTQGKFPMEFYNANTVANLGYRIDLIAKVPAYSKEDFSTKEARQKIKLDITYNPKKAIIASEYFGKWKEELQKEENYLPLQSEDVSLFDDSHYNNVAFKDAGFTILPNGANKLTRKDNDTYTQSYPVAIEKIKSIVSAAEKELLYSNLLTFLKNEQGKHSLLSFGSTARRLATQIQVFYAYKDQGYEKIEDLITRTCQSLNKGHSLFGKDKKFAKELDRIINPEKALNLLNEPKNTIDL